MNTNVVTFFLTGETNYNLQSFGFKKRQRANWSSRLISILKMWVLRIFGVSDTCKQRRICWNNINPLRCTAQIISQRAFRCFFSLSRARRIQFRTIQNKIALPQTMFQSIYRKDIQHFISIRGWFSRAQSRSLGISDARLRLLPFSISFSPLSWLPSTRSRGDPQSSPPPPPPPPPPCQPPCPGSSPADESEAAPPPTPPQAPQQVLRGRSHIRLWLLGTLKISSLLLFSSSPFHS